MIVESTLYLEIMMGERHVARSMQEHIVGLEYRWEFPVKSAVYVTLIWRIDYVCDSQISPRTLNEHLRYNEIECTSHRSSYDGYVSHSRLVVALLS